MKHSRFKPTRDGGLIEKSARVESLNEPLSKKNWPVAEDAATAGEPGQAKISIQVSFEPQWSDGMRRA